MFLISNRLYLNLYRTHVNIRESVVGGIILTLERRVLFVKTKRNMNRVKMRMAV